MKYAIVKVINGNYFIHAEDITVLTSAKTQFHGLCQTLWNASDVISACVAIMNENLEVVEGYIENISHPAPEPEAQQPEPEENVEPEVSNSSSSLFEGV